MITTLNHNSRLVIRFKFLSLKFAVLSYLSIAWRLKKTLKKKTVVKVVTKVCFQRLNVVFHKKYI